MKFFIPDARTGDDAEAIHRVIRRRLEAMGLCLEDRRVYALLHEDGAARHAEVGQPHPLNREPVIAIFKARGQEVYHVCTINRGILAGKPIAVAASSLHSAEDFDQCRTGARPRKGRARRGTSSRRAGAVKDDENGG